jgi:hypothetical protein
MPISLPNLDDLNWEQLTEEGRSLIPGCAPDWTNHNPSDPGITLMELFAHMTELLHYRINRIGDENRREYFRLIAGRGTQLKGAKLQEEVRKSISGLHEIARAVTPADFETLALNVRLKHDSGRAERAAIAKCIPLRNLESGESNRLNAEAPGHVSLVVLSDRPRQTGKSLLNAVRVALEPARLLTTRLHVVQPRFFEFGVRLTVVPDKSVLPEDFHREAAESLSSFFDPLQGGPDGSGWPFGRSIHVSEIYQYLDQLKGLDYITRSRHRTSQNELDELVVASSEQRRLRWNSARNLESVSLDADELPAFSAERSEITVAPPENR